jgi:hypothetical protein
LKFLGCVFLLDDMLKKFGRLLFGTVSLALQFFFFADDGILFRNYFLLNFIALVFFGWSKSFLVSFTVRNKIIETFSL